MPRPTPAQLASGSATVVLSALALLLFTRTTHALGVAAIGVAAMALGLLVATALPMSRALKAASRPGSSKRTRGAAAPAPRPKAHAGAGADSSGTRR
ncbi:hypothetical protein ACIQ9E_16010 [Streptomyces sp. NPDC094448]|uniref:hypothetical protein n=1 Tax=Streptomyces sp. NPDC094448 TaxID=3366063 RepID=UPI00381FC80F